MNQQADTPADEQTWQSPLNNRPRTKTEKISILLTKDEMEFLTTAAELLKVKKSQALRTLAFRDHKNFAEYVKAANSMREIVIPVLEMRDELNRLGNNLNQTTKALNALNKVAQNLNHPAQNVVIDEKTKRYLNEIGKELDDEKVKTYLYEILEILEIIKRKILPQTKLELPQ